MSDNKTDANSGTGADAAAMFTKPVVLELPFSGTVVRDRAYGCSGQHADIYYPSGLDKPVPAVILVTGYPDPGFEKMTGMKLKDIVQNQCWGKLLAASGMAVILYTAADPVQDVLELVDWIAENSAAINIDAQRLGLLSLSGNVPNALHVLHKRQQFRCAALCYGFMLDSETDKGVSAAAAQFRFANPNATDIDLAPELALLLVRAGKDAFPGLNNSIDRFVAKALKSNRELELINYAQGVHAFDIQDASTRVQQLLQRILGFYQQRLQQV